MAAAVADAAESMAWGPSRTLYLSYGIAAIKGRRPALMDAVVAMPSFTFLSPELGLDYFAVLDGYYGEAAARHLQERLGAAIAGQILGELCTQGTPRYAAGPHDVPGWWTTTLRAALRAVHEEAVVSDGGAVGDGATALVALVLEKYVVLANSGASKAVVSRGGEVLQLSPEPKANGPDEKQAVGSFGVAAGSSLVKPGASTAAAEVVAVERTPEDDFLILASDGLWEGLTPAAACAFVRQRLLTRTRMDSPWWLRLDAGGGSPAVVARELAEHAVHKGSNDNVSVILILYRDFWAARANK
ncbi:hypothetical protein ACP4OV_020920 [Aristida adscensionis]